MILKNIYSEVQTAKILGVNNSESENGVLDCAGKESYQYLKRTIQLLEMSKPPKTIPAESLFDGIIKKVEKLANGKNVSDVIGKPMLTSRFTPMHMVTDFSNENFMNLLGNFRTFFGKF